ncbi:MAG: TPM domain-containing protein [Casimicrobiaceae bacterium]
MAVVLLLCAGLNEFGPARAAGPTPTHTGWVTDLAGVLTPDERSALTTTLADYEAETTHQIVVLTVASLDGESIEALSLRTANAWKAGRKGVDNGILVVVAPADRKARIELGRGFERYISNAQAGDIIDRQMAPSFRRNEYGKGLDLGVRELMRQGRQFRAPKQAWWR